MIILRKFENRYIITIITIFIIILIGFIDYITGEELSFSIFYIIPISLFALYRGTKALQVISCSIFASLLWFFAEFFTRNYSNIYFPIWNAFVRLFIFNAIGLLLLYFKEKDQKLNEVNSKLKGLNEEKNKFIGIAAHDLRSPIGGIFSLSGLLIAKNGNKLKPEVLDVLNLIKDMSNNTLTVLQNLLDVSKIESGMVELKLESQDYICFIKHQVFLSQILANQKKINISLESEVDNLRLIFDSHYLSEVIDNLLSNAIKYSFISSEIIVKISLVDKNQVLTEVIDKGKGIPEEEQKGLFNYFHTTSTQPTDGESSTGLGLAIVKRIIVLHNGEIGVRSVINQGSNFYFKLTVKNSDE